MTALVSTDTHDRHPGGQRPGVIDRVRADLHRVRRRRSDRGTDLAEDNRLDTTTRRPDPATSARSGEIPVRGRSTTLTLALGFGATAAKRNGSPRQSAAPFALTRAAYQTRLEAVPRRAQPGPEGLERRTRPPVPGVRDDDQGPRGQDLTGRLHRLADFPWGQAVDATGAGGGGNGYHFVWARDEYQQVSALLAAGDDGRGQRAVNWLFTRQQLPDGHFPQNSTRRRHSRPDQRAAGRDRLPDHPGLADRPVRPAFYTDHIAKAADYLVANGPVTPQERWEETGGYSPSTIADEIAGLTAAAAIAEQGR